MGEPKRTIKPLCRHCERRRANRARTLCKHCYSNNTIKNLYPRATRKHVEPSLEELDALIEERLRGPLPRWWLEDVERQEAADQHPQQSPIRTIHVPLKFRRKYGQ
jgi:hypothetical protein